MEGYFVLVYFLSLSFLSKVVSLTDELKLSVSSITKNGLILTSVKMALYKDYNITIKNRDPIEYIDFLLNDVYKHQANLLDAFLENYDYHSSSYNEKFNAIIFSNVCSYITTFPTTTTSCEIIDGGILTKGIYSTSVKFWDNIRQIHNDYINSDRLPTTLYSILNTKLINTIDTMHNIYLDVSINLIVDNILLDIEEVFNKEYFESEVLFIVYICYLVLSFFVLWKIYLYRMKKELWKTKAILSAIRPDIIIDVPEIKNFIMKNSSIAIFTNNVHK